MNYYVLDNENNAFFNEDYSGFSNCSYGGASVDGQPCGLTVSVDIENKFLQVVDTESNTLVEASTGACKTRRCVFPYMLSCIHSGHSMIVHDPKGELLKFSKPTLDKKDYKIIVLNFRDLMKGDRYNIFQEPAREYQYGNRDRGIEMLKAIINTIMTKYHSPEDPFWEFSSGSYFLMLAMLACEIYDYEDVTIENIFKLHIQANEKSGSSTCLNKYFERDQDNMLYRLASLTMEAPNDTKRSIFTVFVQAISDFVLNDALCDMTCKSTFDIKNIIEQKIAVFLITRDEASVHSALVTAMVNQFYTILIDEAHEHYNGRLPIRIEFILDEFANMGNIKIESMISAARSRNLRFLFCIQSVRQLSLIYGEDIAKIILDNCDNTIYLHSSDMETLRLVSDRCGEKYVSDTHKRPLVSVEKLQYLKKGEALMLLNRVRPFFVNLPDASCYGVEFAESIDLELREFQHRESQNFRAVAEKKANDDMLYGVKKETRGRRSSENIKDKDTKDENDSEPKSMAEKLMDTAGLFKNIEANRRDWLG